MLVLLPHFYSIIPLLFSTQVYAQFPIKNCLSIIEGDFDEYYEVRGESVNLLPYRASQQFRIIVDDQEPENVVLLVKTPESWRFYSFDKDEYFSRELNQVDFEHAFTFKGFLFYSPNGYIKMGKDQIKNFETELEIGCDDINALAPEVLEDIKEKCWNETDHCYGDSDQLMQETMTDHFVVQMKEELQIIGSHNSNELYIHDLVSGLDFCFPPTLKTHSDCDTDPNNKFTRVQARFPVVRPDSQFLQRRQKYAEKKSAEVAVLTGAEPKGTECPDVVQ